MYATHGNFRVIKEIGVEELTSEFRLKVEIRVFCACAMKNMQYKPYLWLNWQNFHVLKEIGIEEHNVDVRFKSRIGNMAVLCMLCTCMHINFS